MSNSDVFLSQPGLLEVKMKWDGLKKERASMFVGELIYLIMLLQIPIIDKPSWALGSSCSGKIFSKLEL